MPELAPIEAYDDHDRAEQAGIREEADDTTPVPIRLRDRLLRVRPEWLTERPPPRRWLLEQGDPETDGETRQGWLPLGEAGMLAAAGGTGKTVALVQLAIAVATGTAWYGYHVAAPGRVLLALAEEDEGETRRRLHDAAKAAGLTGAQIDLVAERVCTLPLAGQHVALLERDVYGNPIESATWLQLREILREGPEWRLVALDPLSRFGGLDENDNAQATRMVTAVQSLIEVPGRPTVLVAHHTSKASQRDGDDAATAARGASAFVDAFRWCASMTTTKEHDPADVRLKATKSNYAFRGQPVDLVRGAGGMLRPLSRLERRQAEQDARTQAAHEHLARAKERVIETVRAGRYASRNQVQAAVGGTRSVVMQAIGELVADGVLVEGGKSIEVAE